MEAPARSCRTFSRCLLFPPHRSPRTDSRGLSRIWPLAARLGSPGSIDNAQGPAKHSRGERTTRSSKERAVATDQNHRHGASLVGCRRRCRIKRRQVAECQDRRRLTPRLRQGDRTGVAGGMRGAGLAAHPGLSSHAAAGGGLEAGGRAALALRPRLPRRPRPRRRCLWWIPMHLKGRMRLRGVPGWGQQRPWLLSVCCKSIGGVVIPDG